MKFEYYNNLMARFGQIVDAMKQAQPKYQSIQLGESHTKISKMTLTKHMNIYDWM